MSNNKSLITGIDLGGAPGDLLKDIFGPGAQNMGKVFGAISGRLRHFFRSMEFQNEMEDAIFEKNIKEFKNNLNTIPDQNIITTPSELAFPIFERMRYVSNPELSSLFRRLLLKASNIETVSYAHPGFIHIIDRLSPDDAKVLNEFRFNSASFITVKGTVEFNNKPINSGYKELETNFSVKGLDFPENISMYLHNLYSLGLLQWNIHNESDNPDEYKKIVAESKKIKDFVDFNNRNIKGTDIKYEITRGSFIMSSFGEKFINCCLVD